MNVTNRYRILDTGSQIKEFIHFTFETEKRIAQGAER